MNSTDGDASQSDSTDTQESVLVHMAYPLWRKSVLLAVARAKQLQDAGHRVMVSYCSARRGTCATNYSGNPVACAVCRARSRATIEAAGLEAVPLRTPVAQNADDDEITLSDRKELAQGVQSGITTTFRTMAGEVSRKSIIGRIRSRYYRTALGLTRSLHAVASRFRPDRIEVFNGRHACSRVALVVARRLRIPFNTLEVTIPQRPIIFDGHTPHDRKAIQRRIRRQPVDRTVAEQFYARRRTPANNKFARKHAAVFTPPSADGFARKISIFLSSQDEFESLGKDWVSPFLDYASVVQRACRENPDYLFCIRFHPNQADIAADVEAPFAEISGLPNVKIYSPTDTANTYTLVEWSDWVVTFGSSLTIEACWMGKPTMMLGPSMFDDLEISRNPRDCDEFMKILREPPTPSSSDNAARFAWYTMFDQDEVPGIHSENGQMQADGLRLCRAWSAQVARTADNLFCRAVKYLTRVVVRRETQQQNKRSPEVARTVDAERRAA